MKPRTKGFNTTELALQEACPASAVVRDEAEHPKHPGMWWGIFVHRFMEYAGKHNKEVGLQYIRDKYPRALPCVSAIDVDALPRGDDEVNWAHDAELDVSRRIHWRMPTLPQEVSSRADRFVRAAKDGRLRVIDWKCGQRPEANGNVQLLGQACAARAEVRAAGEHAGRGAILTVGHILPAPGGVVLHNAEATEWQLDDHCERLARAAAATQQARAAYAAGETPEYRPGAHCGDCGARLECPQSAVRRQP